MQDSKTIPFISTQPQFEKQDFLFQDWGLIDYEKALSQQLQLVEKVADENLRGVLVFCTHPPVVTLGRATKVAEDLQGWRGATVEVSRGGRATYHGPSQLVIYPIINLNYATNHRPAKDIGIYLRNFEQAIVSTLAEFGIFAQGKTYQKKSEHDAETDETGVWIGANKIASLGIAVKRWVTYHGAAVNLEYDPQAFQGLRPCGFSPQVMTCVETQIQKPVNRAQFQSIMQEKLNQAL